MVMIMVMVMIMIMMIKMIMMIIMTMRIILYPLQCDAMRCEYACKLGPECAHFWINLSSMC